MHLKEEGEVKGENKSSSWKGLIGEKKSNFPGGTENPSKAHCRSAVQGLDAIRLMEDHGQGWAPPPAGPVGTSFSDSQLF